MVEAVSLTLDDLRTVTAYASACAMDVLPLFERVCPHDPRPRAAIAAALDFAGGGKRTKALRDVSWAALRAAQETGDLAAQQAARSAMAASGAAYLHPLPNATQVKHILGSAAHAARAVELAAGDDAQRGNDSIAAAALRATPGLLAVLRRFPPAPTGGGRVGQLLHGLDAQLRSTSQ